MRILPEESSESGRRGRGLEEDFKTLTEEKRFGGIIEQRPRAFDGNRERCTAAYESKLLNFSLE